MPNKYKYLNQINNPTDLKKVSKDNLPFVCQELRDFIITSCSQNPGHLGSSLGAVELIVALHYVYNTPTDKLIFDVGHQAYAHKILTGRRNVFQYNRTKNGISGFPNRDESPYDAFGVGHSSTSISAALGIAQANKILCKNEKVVALIGDGAMTGGLAMEAMNNCSSTDILIVLNDNNQSIDNITGAIHDYLLKITTNPSYNKLKSTIWEKVGDGKLRSTLQKLTLNAKSSLVRNTGGALFEALGFRYFGPVDGNNITSMVDVLQKLKDIPGPKLLHTTTIKGKGYKKAEQEPITWHAPGKFNFKTAERIIDTPPKDRYQDVFGEVLTELADTDKRIIGITPAMCSGCGMTPFAAKYPNRFFDVGIAEEHAVTFSAGLACAGAKPFCNIYSSFSQRAYDQIIHDVALQHLPVVLCFDRGGLVGEDGATHQGCFDMAAYRSIPNVIISAPSNEIELKNLMYSALQSNVGPYIIRYPRGYGEGVNWRKASFQFLPTGKAQKLISGSKLAILCLGPVVNRVQQALKELANNSTTHYILPSLYDMRFLKPIDKEVLEYVGSNYNYILTLEEGCIKGGLYSEVVEYLASKENRPIVEGIGIPDEFIGCDKQENQRDYCNLTTNKIAQVLINIFKKI